MYTIQTAATVGARGTVITIAPPIERIRPGDPIRLNGKRIGRVRAIEKANHPHHVNDKPCTGLVITIPVKPGDTIEFPQSPRKS
ncbi:MULTISPECIES: hypothetical protein [Lacticaseibacillus]|jgi:hypothetical protein|uniref:Uncharacterized protein n=6 Tax=Lacticaseibacillus TaxID=2759736 RepID=A0AAN1C6W0_LACCA|nr:MULTISPECIES: hypothetical protein [Lacticaseibacillus]OFR91065.1 hypothetical protein HMPREF2861_13155 [Lactobacillus sp. HMSC068F07]ARY90348.1 hypothetical protein BGL52_00670 [Lacticaseibacillus casei]KAB1969907.1 hypothetical protein F9B82_05965 [Lacticaseibacillus casei]KLI75320.1 hypothetical protein AAW28_07340 [Lacticaseibacillus casei]KRK13373.1 hypothetical protein FD51_GL001587 [Lacticaseibacillus zeae DSM 20178 = KCTC 3804]